MFGERRKDKRYAINRVAKFETPSGSLPRDCLVIDISASGARLFSETNDIPDDFILTITGERVIRQTCRVMWRLGGELGVSFVTDHHKSVDHVTQDLRAHVRNVFGNAGRTQ